MSGDSISFQPRELWANRRESVLKDARVAHEVLKKANGLGEHLLAVEIGEAILAAGSVDAVPVMQQLARALAILGSSEQARIILERIPADRPDAAETAGLLGRIEKDLAAAARTPREREIHLEKARESYVSGWRSANDLNDPDGAAYCGINAAAISVGLGDMSMAKDWAEKSLPLVADREDYYSVATAAEALLILGSDEAKDIYRKAADLAASEKRWADLASTRKQCRELSLRLFGRRDHCDECFPPGAIGIFSGEMVPDPVIGPLRPYVAEWFELHSIRAVFGTPNPGWDLELLDTARLAGIEIHLVLPLPTERFIDAEPMFNEPGWLSRFHEILPSATSVTILDSDLPGKEFTHRMTAARASLLADHLGFNLRALAIGESFGQTALPVWQRANLEIRAIHPSAPTSNALPDKETQSDGVPFERSLAPANKRTRFAAIAHLHFAIYDKLSGGAFASFQKSVLGTIAASLANSSHPPVSREGFAGDYRFVFGNLHDAVTCSLDLLEALRSLNDEENEPPFPPPSICLNAGLVRQLINPVIHFYSDEGMVASRAAGIARQLPPGSLTATETFVALTSLESIRGFRFEHAGNFPLPDATERLFRVHSSES